MLLNQVSGFHILLHLRIRITRRASSAFFILIQQNFITNLTGSFIVRSPVMLPGPILIIRSTILSKENISARETALKRSSRFLTILLYPVAIMLLLIHSNSVLSILVGTPGFSRE